MFDKIILVALGLLIGFTVVFFGLIKEFELMIAYSTTFLMYIMYVIRYSTSQTRDDRADT